MSTELTDIDGVGQKLAERLTDAGFESVEDVTAGTIDELAAVDGLADARAEAVMQSSFRTLESDDTTTGADETATDPGPAEEPEDPEEYQGFEVGFQCSAKLYPHVVGAVADELRDAAQSNDRSRGAQARAVFDALMDAEPTGEVTIQLHMDELVAFRRGVKHRARRYRRSGTLPNLGSTLANLSEHLQDIRNEHWGE